MAHSVELLQSVPLLIYKKNKFQMFIDGKADIRYYNLGGYIRKPSDALKAYFCVLDGEPEHAAIAQYELPLSILAMLGVKISDYAVRANASGFTIDPVTRRGFGNTATYIRF